MTPIEQFISFLETNEFVEVDEPDHESRVFQRPVWVANIGITARVSITDLNGQQYFHGGWSGQGSYIYQYQDIPKTDEGRQAIVDELVEENPEKLFAMGFMIGERILNTGGLFLSGVMQAFEQAE